LDRTTTEGGSVPPRVRDLIKQVEPSGWHLVGQRGSHRQYKHPTKKGRVTIPGKPSRELYPELERSILRQAGLLMGGDP
jgi:predicted RNA binding protein YcfA (HicA-like mRNA interferase family)